MQNALIHGHAVFRAARAGSGSITIKIITYSRGQRMDKSNAVEINKQIYLVMFLHITTKVIPIKFGVVYNKLGLLYLTLIKL